MELLKILSKKFLKKILKNINNKKGYGKEPYPLILAKKLNKIFKLCAQITSLNPQQFFYMLQLSVCKQFQANTYP